MFRHFCIIIFILAASTSAKPQAPDLSKIKDDKEKVKAWLSYCSVLRLNTSGAPDNYVKLQAAGLKGLQMVSDTDRESKASFYSYTALGYYYQIKFDSAQYYFYESLHSAQQAHAVKLIAGACQALMSINFQLQQLDKVDSCKNILQTIADTSKNESILRDIYSAFGSYYEQKSYYSTAEDYYIKSIQLREKNVDTTTNLKEKFDYAIQCDQLSKLYLNTQMADKSIGALRQGMRFAHVSPVVDNRLLSSFVEAYTTSGNIDSALYYLSKLNSNIKNQNSFPSEIVSSNLNVAIYYIDHKMYEKALPYAQRGDSLAHLSKSPFLIFQSQMIMGRYLEETGKYQQSINLLNQALPIAQQLTKELYSNILQYLALDYKGLNNPSAALQYYEQYSHLQDTLSKEKVSRTFADLETRYQTAKKENQIASLDQQNKLSALELKQAANTKTMLILGLVSLGIIALLLYFIYRNKEKLNKILNQQNKQLDDLNRELSIANDTKAKMFGVISHDLRSPVSKIVQLLHLQKENSPHLTDELRVQYHERVNKASQNVLETMEDILLWSKSQMSHFTPQYRQVKIKPVIMQEISLLEEQVKEKNLRIALNVSDNLEKNTDENFASVIFRNLIQNAINQCRNNDTVSIDERPGEIVITNPSYTITAGDLNASIQQNSISSRYSGLGLQIVKDLSSQLGMKIHYTRADERHISAVISWGA
ncbi:MAG TPA: tetratricopeptide repeat-containing sensor histidine kinase [Chitinophagaceae bacterium]|nr:tetratricopeptide repeat-containing sensor histidine kinase [Chitinophagaceae bacterium]